MGEIHTELQRPSTNLLDFIPILWGEYPGIKKRLRKLEKKYYGLGGFYISGRHVGRRKMERISEEDLATVRDLEESLMVLNDYCSAHEKIYLNSKVYHLRFRLQDFLKSYQTTQNKR